MECKEPDEWTENRWWTKREPIENVDQLNEPVGPNG